MWREDITRKFLAGAYDLVQSMRFWRFLALMLWIDVRKGVRDNYVGHLWTPFLALFISVSIGHGLRPASNLSSENFRWIDLDLFLVFSSWFLFTHTALNSWKAILDYRGFREAFNVPLSLGYLRTFLSGLFSFLPSLMILLARAFFELSLETILKTILWLLLVFWTGMTLSYLAASIRVLRSVYQAASLLGMLVLTIMLSGASAEDAIIFKIYHSLLLPYYIEPTVVETSLYVFILGVVVFLFLSMLSLGACLSRRDF
jgi:hypothetical protein